MIFTHAFPSMYISPLFFFFFLGVRLAHYMNKVNFPKIDMQFQKIINFHLLLNDPGTLAYTHSTC